MIPPVGSWPGGLVRDAEPSPPSLPAAHTVTTPSAASARCSFDGRRVRVELAAAGRAVGVVGDLDRRAGRSPGRPRRTGGRGSPAPSSAPSRRRRSAGPRRSRCRRGWRRAPRPCSFVPSVRVVGRPATMPLTWVPCPPPEMVSVSSESGSVTTQLAAGVRLVEAEALVAGARRRCCRRRPGGTGASGRRRSR